MNISEEKFIDLEEINSGTEISLKTLLSTLQKERKFVKHFTFEEININDSSSSIYFNEFDNKLLFSIYGPRECKFRDKAKSDQAIIEIYSKFNCEYSKESKILYKFN
jgi:hypothetical protein